MGKFTRHSYLRSFSSLCFVYSGSPVPETENRFQSISVHSCFHASDDDDLLCEDGMQLPGLSMRSGDWNDSCLHPASDSATTNQHVIANCSEGSHQEKLVAVRK